MSALPSQLEAATTVLRRVPPTCSSRRRRRAPQGTITRCSPTGREAWRAQIGVHAVLVPQLLDPGTYDPTVVNLSAWGRCASWPMRCRRQRASCRTGQRNDRSHPGLAQSAQDLRPPGSVGKRQWTCRASARRGPDPRDAGRGLDRVDQGPGPGHRQIGCEAVDADLHGLADRRGIGGHPVVGAAVRPVRATRRQRRITAPPERCGSLYREQETRLPASRIERSRVVP